MTIHKNISIFILICTLFLLFLTVGANADIYRYVDENGVECFTDAPVNKKAVRIMKDRPSPRQPASFKNTTGKKKSGIAKTGKPGGDKSCLAGKLPVQGRITSLVGLRSDPFDGIPRFHNGVDIAIPEGTPVKPIAAGYVIFSGARGGYGNMVIVEHPDGMRTIYAHNSALLVTAGENVDRNTVIAFSGSTGRSTGPHLHFEAWKDDTNITSDFLSYGSEGHTRAAYHGGSHRPAPIRTAVLPDGSILFTNIPYVHP